MKKYIYIIIALLTVGSLNAQKIASVHFHEVGKNYQANSLVTVDGNLYKALVDNNSTPPTSDWEELGSSVSGTPSTVPFFDGSGVITDNANFTYNSSTNRLGLSTTSSNAFSYLENDKFSFENVLQGDAIILGGINLSQDVFFTFPDIVGSTENAPFEFAPISYVDAQIAAIDTGSGAAPEYQSAITSATTVFDGTQKGKENIYVFDGTVSQTLSFDFGDYSVNDQIYIENRGDELLEILPTSTVRLRGSPDIDGRFFVGRELPAMLMARGTIDGKDEFSITGTQGGSLQAISGTVYSAKLLDGTTQNITVGTSIGFTENMLVTVTGNATLNSWSYVSRQEISLNLTSTGSVGDFLTVTYDNGFITVDTDAIEITDEVFVNDTYSFEVGYAMADLSGLITYGQRWRRSSDDQAKDIAFDLNGLISLSSLTEDGVLVSTWLGSNDAYVRKWYNQGTDGNTFDLVQTINTLQPKVANAGVIITDGVDSVIEFDGVDDVMVTENATDWVNGDFAIFTGVNFNTIHNGNILNANGSTMFWYRLASTGSQLQMYLNSNSGFTDVRSATLSDNTNYQLSVTKNSTDISVYRNGIQDGTASSPASDLTTVEVLSMGKVSTSTHPLNGKVKYGLFYRTDQTSNQGAIDAAILNAHQ